MKSIKFWAKDDQPIEKFLSLGSSSLSNSELMAILLKSGNREENATELAKKILRHCNNNLIELSKMNVEALKKFKGVGTIKAITLLSALELGNRKEASLLMDKKVVQSSKEVYLYAKSKLENLSHEETWAIYLNRRNAILHMEKMSSGGLTETVMDVRLIYKKALELKSTGIILLHNHPSGNLKPSQADISITQKIKQAGISLDIPLLDHLIIADGGYFSFADEGKL